MVPDVDDQIAQATSTTTSRSLILGTDGTLTVAQRHRTLANLATGSEADAVLENHLAVEQAIAGTPLTSGNATKLLRDGDGTFAAVFEAIAQARHHINLEYYTLEDVEHDGRTLSELLLEKRRAGVAVNVIYDSYGSSNTPDEFFETLKSAGVNLLEFRPVNPLEAIAEGYSPNDRNHRKIMIVDGEVALVGGVNLATYYQSKTPGSGSSGEMAEQAPEQAPQKDEPDDWRDLSVRIEGGGRGAAAGPVPRPLAERRRAANRPERILSKDQSGGRPGHPHHRQFAAAGFLALLRHPDFGHPQRAGTHLADHRLFRSDLRGEACADRGGGARRRCAPDAAGGQRREPSRGGRAFSLR